MINKKLKPRTIVPKEFYVKRSADFQLEEIISDMGRPGYILVARQMGKTNLLINAKRNLQNDNDIFVYVDLSNRFDDARECFRNITDTIFETSDKDFGGVREEILIERKKEYASHKEHAFELRKILKNVEGRLVIFLDEIDSLTQADYSDKIFAQIRSIYFERVNYSEFERLGYVISGVAEPSEIIKDRSISPFNIGQKIFLGDFTYQEFEEFIDKSMIDISEVVKQRVFYWSNGHPRITWEICSDLEDIRSDISITTEIVDDVVFRKYLSKFDRPPIDHIRSLVQSSKDLRRGIVEIRYGNESSVSDEIKSKLYLAGVLDSKFEEGIVRIKNELIDRALDSSWMEELDSHEAISLSSGDYYFSQENYVEAINVYSELVKSDVLLEQEKLQAKYKMAASYFRLNDFSSVIECTLGNMFDKDSYKAIYLEQLYILGISYMNVDSYDEAVSNFEKVIELSGGEFYFESLVNLSTCLLYMDFSNNKNRVLDLCGEVIAESQSGLSNGIVVSYAYKNIAYVYETEGDLDKAIDNYMLAAKCAPDLYKIKPLFSAFTLLDDCEDVFRKIIDSFDISSLKENIMLSVATPDIDQEVLVNVLITAYMKSIFDDLYEFLDKLIKSNSVYDFDGSAIVYMAGKTLLLNHNIQGAVFFLKYLFEVDRRYVDASVFFESAKLLSIAEDDYKEPIEYYFQSFQNNVTTPDIVDINIFNKFVSDCVEAEDFDKALAYIDLISNQYDPNMNHYIDFILLEYLKFLSLSGNEKACIAIKISEGIKCFCTDDYKRPLISKEYILSVALDVKRFLLDITDDHSHNRNDKVKALYTDGNIEIIKYKNVLHDLTSEKCILIR